MHQHLPDELVQVEIGHRKRQRVARRELLHQQPQVRADRIGNGGRVRRSVSGDKGGKGRGFGGRRHGGSPLVHGEIYTGQEYTRQVLKDAVGIIRCTRPRSMRESPGAMGAVEVEMGWRDRLLWSAPVCWLATLGLWLRRKQVDAIWRSVETTSTDE